MATRSAIPVSAISEPPIKVHDDNMNASSSLYCGARSDEEFLHLPPYIIIMGWEKNIEMDSRRSYPQFAPQLLRRPLASVCTSVGCGVYILRRGLRTTCLPMRAKRTSSWYHLAVPFPFLLPFPCPKQPSLP